ncbi:hypothetical protein WMF39_20320 [Sorangium sp. So ce1504]|uniref:hypothetical protein n=1 Tax=Sorangium sp. So ce1504 TaxID=3133337 RepID=UPI003F631BCF
MKQDVESITRLLASVRRGIRRVLVGDTRELLKKVDHVAVSNTLSGHLCDPRVAGPEEGSTRGVSPPHDIPGYLVMHVHKVPELVKEGDVELPSRSVVEPSAHRFMAKSNHVAVVSTAAARLLTAPAELDVIDDGTVLGWNEPERVLEDPEMTLLGPVPLVRRRPVFQTWRDRCEPFVNPSHTSTLR